MKVAARRTEIMVNLNLFTSPTDEDIPPVESYNIVTPVGIDGDYEVCPPEYERRAAGVLKLMHICAPSSLIGRKVPSCCIRIERDGMLVIHMRAIWGNRKSILIGMATKQEVITADHLKCTGSLLVNEDRLVLNMANGVDLEELAKDEYWYGTAWHAIHYIPMRAFHEFAENFIGAVLRIPRKLDSRIDGIAVFGDERWMPERYSDSFVIRNDPR